MVEDFRNKINNVTNRNLSFGIDNLNKALNGLQEAMVYTLASAPKVGKSSMADYCFVLSPLIHAVKNNIKFNVLYFSFETNAIQKEYEALCFFLHKKFNISKILLPNGVTKENESMIDLSSIYLKQELYDDNFNKILVNQEIIDKVEDIYAKEMIKFYQHVKIIDRACDINGMKNHIQEWLTDLDDDCFKVIICDHVRKIKGVNNTIKQRIDEWSGFCVELRDRYKITSVNIIHTNRVVASVERMKFAKDFLYPGSDDIKDSGNLSEDSDFVFTLFNPNDDRYRLEKHFGVDIRLNDQIMYPNLRTLHLVEARYAECPQHFQFNLFGNLKVIKPVVL